MRLASARLKASRLSKQLIIVSHSGLHSAEAAPAGATNTDEGLTTTPNNEAVMAHLIISQPAPSWIYGHEFSVFVALPARRQIGSGVRS